ncbi:hypothetical protein [Streptomyces sp. NPDC092952]|uniref:hypothetical protein n=1 Tax=Streptomyces sp. NPDC092952 TaxID=3366018 RepID=UPI0038028F5A
MNILIKSAPAVASCPTAQHGLLETVEAILFDAVPEFAGGLGVVVVVAAATWVVRRFNRGQLPDQPCT